MEPTVQFFILADLHLGKNEVSATDLQVTFQNMEQLSPKASLLLAGDLTDQGDFVWWQFLETLFQKTTLRPILMTLGNHDVRGHKGGHAEKADAAGFLNCWKVNWTKEDTLTDSRFYQFQTLIPFYQKLLKKYSLQDSLPQTLYSYQQIAFTHFIQLSTIYPLKDQAYLGKEQLQWLQKILINLKNNHPKDPIFITSHQALNDTHLRSNEYGGFGPDNDALIALLNDFKELNLHFLSGHIHNGLGVTQILKGSFGPLIDLTSYCYPDNGLPLKNIGYLCTVTENKITLLPYFLGNALEIKPYPYPLYEKILYY